MSAGGDVYDVVDYARASGVPEASARAGLDLQGSPTAGSFRRGLLLGEGGVNMTKTNVRSIAYFLIVGGVVVWIVGHLAPIRG